ncbi:biotin--[acetyl-CoA-carboxylase] ligase [Tessaracoccus sp. OS52]|uniref:biotin--[acetyl-CoA-carboxylase] ligase n=1 Tax=Tessaracoccus sp. OS52 TaxID=2886691 RepID=UPI001D1177C5|nr:biotin--[acetyl-CoA-carboxylase] ligase [Tessaracoccus sp. OS52]MCC2592344.1 biotin--[acetyl-CoA-carboxylase] ligase [Tessaracoccus sp. OS52]
MENQPDAGVIADALEPGTLWREIETVATTGSTNADVAARAAAGAAEGLVLVASEQTGGRGRRDRTWASPAGKSVSISLLLQPGPDLPRWGWLSLLAGLAVSGALSELVPDPQRVELKWPNDVLISGRKLCGILSERIEHSSGARAVVGIGVNLTLEQEDLPVPTATSLRLEGAEVDPSQLVAAILRHFESRYRRWQETGQLRAEYEARCASIGAELEVIVDERHTTKGRGHGVDEFGRLLVATSAGISAFAAGDVVHARLGT